MKKPFIIALLSILSTFALPLSAEEYPGLGMRFEIQTSVHSYIGKPYWLLMIRDVDHNQTLPYQFAFVKGQNHWLAYTQGRNYLITKSTLVFTTYNERENNYRTYELKNFCRLESNGRIQRDKAKFIRITGNLTARDNTYRCQVDSFIDPNVTVM